MWTAPESALRAARERHPVSYHGDRCPSCGANAPMSFQEPRVIPLEGGPKVLIESRAYCTCGCEVLFRMPAEGQDIR